MLGFQAATIFIQQFGIHSPVLLTSPKLWSLSKKFSVDLFCDMYYLF